MSMFKEFRDFAVKGNVIDLAVGVIIGAAFGKIVTSVVEDLVMPPIGFLMGKVDFSNLFVILPGQQAKIAEYAKKVADAKGTDTTIDTLAELKASGVSAFTYGAFINNVIQFVIVAFAVFLLVRAINRLKDRVDTAKANEEPITKDCPFCLSTIPAKATKCSQCTADQPTTA